jgi:hypothetical protein
MPLIIAADNLEPLNPVIGQAVAGLDSQPLQEMARRLAQAGASLLCGSRRPSSASWPGPAWRWLWLTSSSPA